MLCSDHAVIVTSVWRSSGHQSGDASSRRGDGPLTGKAWEERRRKRGTEILAALPHLLQRRYTDRESNGERAEGNFSEAVSRWGNLRTTEIVSAAPLCSERAPCMQVTQRISTRLFATPSIVPSVSVDPETHHRPIPNTVLTSGETRLPGEKREALESAGVISLICTQPMPCPVILTMYMVRAGVFRRGAAVVKWLTKTRCGYRGPVSYTHLTLPTICSV
eukprot:2494182-Rhodomonas_salina.1